MRKEKAKTKNFPTHGIEYKLIQNSKSKMKSQFHHYFKYVLDTICVRISNSNTNHI